MLNLRRTPTENKLISFQNPQHIKENFCAHYRSEKTRLAVETIWQHGTGGNHHEHKRETAKVWCCFVSEWLRSNTEPNTDVWLVRNCPCILTPGSRKVSSSALRISSLTQRTKMQLGSLGFWSEAWHSWSLSGEGTCQGTSWLLSCCKIPVVELRGTWREKWGMKTKCKHQAKKNYLPATQTPKCGEATQRFLTLSFPYFGRHVLEIQHIVLVQLRFSFCNPKQRSSKAASSQQSPADLPGLSFTTWPCTPSSPHWLHRPMWMLPLWGQI